MDDICSCNNKVPMVNTNVKHNPNRNRNPNPNLNPHPTRTKKRYHHRHSNSLLLEISSQEQLSQEQLSPERMSGRITVLTIGMNIKGRWIKKKKVHPNTTAATMGLKLLIFQMANWRGQLQISFPIFYNVNFQSDKKETQTFSSFSFNLLNSLKISLTIDLASSIKIFWNVLQLLW